MSKTDEQIAELCPNGVEHKTLDLGQISYGNTDHLYYVFSEKRAYDTIEYSSKRQTELILL